MRVPTEPVALYPYANSVMDLSCPEEYIPPAALADPLGLGDYAWQVISRMPIPTRPGVRFGDVSQPWFELMVRAVYGTVYDDGSGPRRQIKRVLLLAGKKTGKSTSAAALTVGHQIIDTMPNGQTLVLAPTRDSTRHVFSPILSMATMDPILASRFKPAEHAGRIKDVQSNATIRVAAFELAATTGSAANLLVIDEAHLMVRPTANAIIGQAEQGQITHREPLTWIITTMPVDRLEGVLLDKIKSAQATWSGEEDERDLLFLPFSLPEACDMDDHTQWWRANPNIGHTVELKTLVTGWAKAKKNPKERAFFISQIFNRDPSLEMGAARWISKAKWRSVITTPDEDGSLEGFLDWSDAVWPGVDAGGLDDCSALVMLGLKTDDFGLDHWRVWHKQWLHRPSYEDRRSTAPYDDFVNAGDLVLFDDPMTDVADIVDLIVKVDEARKLACVGVDSYQLREVQTRLLDKIEGDDVVVAVPQGWRLQPPIIWAERQIASKMLRHPDYPMLEWNLGNAVVERRGNARAINKSSLGSAQKIDGLSAFFTAAAVASQKLNQDRANSKAGVLAI